MTGSEGRLILVTASVEHPCCTSNPARWLTQLRAGGHGDPWHGNAGIQATAQSRSWRAIRATPTAPEAASRTSATAALGG